MMLVASTLANVLWLPAAIVVFLLPGWMIARRFAPVAPAVAAFFASAAVFFNLVLLLDSTGVPLHAGSIGLGLGLVAAALAWRRRPPRAATSTAVRVPDLGRFSRHWPWLIPIALAFVSITARVTVDPLSGYDNGFRWDYLGRLVLAQRSLASYPPITAAQFEYYSWCDGIPPLVPLLNFWIYAVTGSVAPTLIAVRVLGEMLLLGTLVFRYSRLLWGGAAGPAAIAALAASSLALWSIAMTQETALTAVSLVAMLYFLEEHRRGPRTATLVWAAVAAGVGALSRDYALAFPLLGIGVLLARRASWRSAVLFGAVAGAVAGPWYLRNWIRTGNPLYPHTLGGLFPGNPVYEEVMRDIAAFWSFGSARFPKAAFCLMLVALAGVPLVFGAIGAWRSRGRGAGALVAGIALTGALWLWSVPYTAAGWVYSARVLLPALALAAVLAGWLGRLRGAARVGAALLLVLAAGDAARRSWLLPDTPFAPAASVSFAEWRTTHALLQDVGANPLWKILVRDAAGGGIVVDHPAHHALLTMSGGVAVPLFSPVLAPTFGAPLAVDAGVAELRQAHVRFITLSLDNGITGRLIRAYPFWREFCARYRPNARVQMLSIFDLNHLVPASSP